MGRSCEASPDCVGRFKVDLVETTHYAQPRVRLSNAIVTRFLADARPLDNDFLTALQTRNRLPFPYPELLLTVRLVKSGSFRKGKPASLFRSLGSLWPRVFEGEAVGGRAAQWHG